ncbi:MAG: LOG family protein [Candidatus Melainabacteria bacterium]|nr:LOG family protein [Candidatus Melainabacteria bacterium]
MKEHLTKIEAALAHLDPTRRDTILQQALEWATASEALEQLKRRGLTFVGFMGSAREHEHTADVCALIEGIASRLGPKFAVITGGGDAVMAAANRGAKNGGSYSIGLNLIAPNTPEQTANGYLDLALPHSGFGHRMDSFLTYTDIMVMGIGGYGTDLEEVYYRQCIQVATHREIPLVYLRPSFWRSKLDLIAMQLDKRLVSADDLRMIHIVSETGDKPDDTVTVRDRQLFRIVEDGAGEIERAVNLITRLHHEKPVAA